MGCSTGHDALIAAICSFAVKRISGAGNHGKFYLVNLESYSIITRMLKRRLTDRLAYLLAHYPAVALLGPRQVGKTTLAQEIAGERPSVYLDLESPAGRAKLSDPEQFFADHEDELVILDEVHRAPEIFRTLRGATDRGRGRGRKAGRFLLLGSAAIDLMKQSGETLAGRISYLELAPFDILEVRAKDMDRLWVRGGFPSSFLADDDALSIKWRQDFIRTYLEREILQFGPRIPAETLRRFWTMLAHSQMELLNAANLARALGVDGKTVAGYLDLLVDLLLVRRLPAWHGNEGKRLVKSPKTYVRDTGLAHTLLRLRNKDDLLGHPVAGQSWESFAVENLIVTAPEGTEANFYRTAVGAEIDLLLTLPNRQLWAIKVKRSSAPKVEKGFHIACADLRPHKRFVVYPGTERFALGQGTEAIGLRELAGEVQAVR
jgi:predicted AAA+ superfamily ATPase